MADVVTLENVDIAYGQHKAVRAASFAIKAGEMYGLVGLNGAGKTSLIKAILGLRDVDKGRVTLKADLDSAKQNHVYLPERFDPPWFLTGMEFIAFSLRLYNLKLDTELAKQYAQKLALDPQALGRKVHNYSKGMRQKLV